VRIISKKRLAEFWSKHPDAEEPLMAWYRITKKASWNNLAEARQDFRHADPADYKDFLRAETGIDSLRDDA